MRAAAAALLGLLLVGTASAAHFNIGEGGIDGWTHSEDAKYSGRFKATASGLTVRRWPVAAHRRLAPCQAADQGARLPDLAAAGRRARAGSLLPPPPPPPASRQPFPFPRPPCPQVPGKAKHYGISRQLDTPVDPAKDLVLQYELKLGNGLTCGGACEPARPPRSAACCSRGGGGAQPPVDAALTAAAACTFATPCRRCCALQPARSAPCPPASGWLPAPSAAHAPTDLKFVTADAAFTPKGLKDDTAYTVMFGPDKCGATNKVGHSAPASALGAAEGQGAAAGLPAPAAVMPRHGCSHAVCLHRLPMPMQMVV